MTDTQAQIPSVVDRTRLVAAGGPVVATHFLRQTAAFALGEEALLLVAPDGAESRVAVHEGGVLAVASDSARILTGGDDGKVVVTNAKGHSETLATDARHRWIDRVALGPDGVIAWSAGKQAFVRTAKGEIKSLDLPSSVGGLAFAPKGVRLAVAHYGGVSLWFPNAQAAPEMLAWKGSHLDALFSPDGKFLVTAMQESTLHGWRLADRKDMRMSGYGARVRSLDWTVGGKWLATSGSTQLILWPFQAKDGPMGKTPRILAPAEAQVEVVACHPKQEVVAVGYADGLVLLVRVDDGAEVIRRVRSFAPDLVLLDVMLPGADGFELCGLVRQGGRTPVIMLTARDQKRDKLRGLELGADDYVTKPFDFEELQARIRAVLRRARQMVVRITLGETLIDFRAFKAMRGHRELRLSRREFDLLSYLAEREGAVVPRSELLREVWGFPDEPSTRAVDYAIRRLRRKIERDPHNPQHIHTVHGDGYCLTSSGH